MMYKLDLYELVDRELLHFCINNEDYMNNFWKYFDPLTRDYAIKLEIIDSENIVIKNLKDYVLIDYRGEAWEVEIGDKLSFGFNDGKFRGVY